VPGPDKIEALKAELSQRYDADDVAFLLESEQGLWAHHDTAVYLDLGTDDAEEAADYARRCADWLGWKFERLKGDPSLLTALLTGDWDSQRFLIVPPGARIGHSTDAAILRVDA